MKFLIIYIVIINFIAFVLYAIDKKKAIKGTWRIKEVTLLSFSLIGGGIGSLLGMIYFRHKTKKRKFTIGVPLLTIISSVILYYIYITFIL